ncbi:MAG: D-glycerate dehydrogenase [Clostridia bacterium]
MKVLVTRNLPGAALERLKNFAEVEINFEDRDLSKTEIMKFGADKDAIITMLSNSIDAEVIDACPQLKIIANYAVGYNNIAIEQATKKNIYVTNTPDVLTNSTADLTWALILAVARRIVTADEFLRKGKFTGWSPELFLGSDIFGKTLGIVGAGRIGRAVAERAVGFKMPIIYTSRERKVEWEKSLNAKYVSMQELLEQADFISLHTALTMETNHLLSSKEFVKMKKSSFVINTGRGQLIDENALVDALENGEIAGAGLDVYEFEPNIIEKLKSLNNVVILPHIGSATIETRNRMANMVVENVLSVLKNERPEQSINI